MTDAERAKRITILAHLSLAGVFAYVIHLMALHAHSMFASTLPLATPAVVLTMTFVAYKLILWLFALDARPHHIAPHRTTSHHIAPHRTT